MIPEALIQVSSTRTVHCLTLTAVAAAELFWLTADRSRVCCKWLSAISLSFIHMFRVYCCLRGRPMSCTVYHYLDWHHPRVVIQYKVSVTSSRVNDASVQCLAGADLPHCLSKLPVSWARWQVASARQLTVSWPPPHVSCILLYPPCPGPATDAGERFVSVLSFRTVSSSDLIKCNM